MSRILGLSLTMTVILALVNCGATLGRGSSAGDHEIGLAVYYSDSLHGRKTASGEPYDKNKLTAAHKEIPLGTIVNVTNLSNRRSVQVKINDRGPFGDSRRIIDLSRAAAERLDMIRAGVIEVRVEIVEAVKSD